MKLQVEKTENDKKKAKKKKQKKRIKYEDMIQILKDNPLGLSLRYIKNNQYIYNYV